MLLIGIGLMAKDLVVSMTSYIRISLQKKNLSEWLILFFLHRINNDPSQLRQNVR